MSAVLSRVAAVAVLGVGLAALSAGADDKKADDKKPADPAKAPDWSGFSSAGEVSGEVTKVSDAGFTLRVSWLAASNTAVRSRSRYVRPPTVSEKHTDYQLTFADEGMVRWRTLPPKGTDEKGKPVRFTDKEKADLKKPAGVTGYAADRGDLKPGHLVDVTLVRPRTVSADKAMPQDLRVKYAVIIGTDPTAVPADPKKSDGGKKKPN